MSFPIICLIRFVVWLKSAQFLTGSGNLGVLRGSLKTAATILRARSQITAQKAAKAPDATMAKKGVTWKDEDDGVEYKPDWVVFQKKLLKTYPEENSNKREELAYIIGDSKLTEKWKSEYLNMTKEEAQKVPAPPSWKNVEDSDDDKPKPLVVRGLYSVVIERLLPLRQLATYCRFAATRYFLVTQNEVVVFRVRRIDEKELVFKDPGTGKKGRHYAAFEYKSTPWSASGTDRLNFNLAVWALACMGMNDHHREMEGPGNTPLDGMARLTHWVEDKVKGEYTNVISGRVISKEDWAKRKTHFVKLTTADGYSKTSDFYRTDTGSLATQMGAISLAAGQSSGNAASGAPGTSTGRPTTPSSSRAPQPQPSTGRSPPRDPANTPAPPKPRTSPPGAPNSNRTGTPPPAGAPRAHGSPAGPSRSTTAAEAPTSLTATFNKKKYPVTMKDGKPFSISLGTNDVRAIKRTGDGKGYCVQDKGKAVSITLTK